MKSDVIQANEIRCDAELFHVILYCTRAGASWKSPRIHVEVFATTTEPSVQRGYAQSVAPAVPHGTAMLPQGSEYDSLGGPNES